MSHQTAANPWVFIPKPQSDARFRLFCFPYGGGSAAIFRAWPEALGDRVEVAAIQLPGRGTRFREAPLKRLDTAAPVLADALRDYLDRPYVLFGQSLGALIGFELARELRRRGCPAPLHFFISARSAPHLANDWMPIHNLPDDQLVKEVQRRYGGIPQAVLTDPEMLPLFLPILRADLEMLETYDHVPEAPLACDMTAYGGYQDWAVPDADLNLWAEHTTGKFTQQMFPGNHFFVQNTPSFMRAFSSALAAVGAEE